MCVCTCDTSMQNALIAWKCLNFKVRIPLITHIHLCTYIYETVGSSEYEGTTNDQTIESLNDVFSRVLALCLRLHAVVLLVVAHIDYVWQT